MRNPIDQAKSLARLVSFFPLRVNSDEPVAHLLPWLPEAKAMLIPGATFWPSGAKILALERMGLPPATS